MFWALYPAARFNLERSSTVFIAHVTLTVDAARRPAILQHLVEDAPAVRAMPGCLAFTPFADPTDAGTLGVLHEWASEADFAGYTDSPIFARFGRDVRAMALVPPVSRRFTAALVETLR